MSKRSSKSGRARKKSDGSKSDGSMPDWKAAIKKHVKADEEALRKEYWFTAPDFLVDLLSVDRKRDLPLFYCLFNVTVLCALNLAILPFMMNTHWLPLFVIVLIRFVMVGMPRFVLALHYASHLPVIKPVWLNKFLLEFILCPLMGIPCGTYYIHHVVMHHKEDNIHPLDLSSTMPYQRDKVLHVIFYWLRFELGIWFELPYWMVYKEYYSRLVGLAFGFGLYTTMIYSMWQIRPAFAIWIFIVPEIIVSFALMFGNFSQHIFVNPDAYTDDHQLTINITNSIFNQVAFNDGYHIVHHKLPNLHWTELPTRFGTDREISLHGKSNAFVFEGTDYGEVGFLVVSGQLEKLAKKMVPCNDEMAKWTIDQRVAEMKRRLKPIPMPPHEFKALFGFLEFLFY